MYQHHALILFLSFLLLLAQPTLGMNTSTTTSSSITNPSIAAITNSSFFIAKSGCQLKCGNVIVPYPFGIGNINGLPSPGSSCAISSYFNLTCNTTSDDPAPKLFFGSIQVLSISQTEVRLKNNVQYRCYDEKGTVTGSTKGLRTSWGSRRPYTFSETANKFTVVGCDVYALISWPGQQLDGLDSTGCLSMCSKPADVVAGSCTGIGCCQINIPKGIKNTTISLGRLKDSSPQDSSLERQCTYAFLGEQDKFQFKGVSDLGGSVPMRTNFINQILDNVHVVLDFVIGNQTCDAAAQNPSTYSCHGNTLCTSSNTDYGGYLCSCERGYEGNPYLSPGCKDINECNTATPTLNNCHEKATCINTPGSFECKCVDHYSGNGTKDGSGCYPDSTQFPVIELSLGLSFGFLLFITIVTLLYFGIKKRRQIKQREKFFRKNGGLLMKQKISSIDGTSADSSKFFTAEELKKATNNYAEDRILGQGGYGVVYKGILPDQHVVAIKKSKVMDVSQVEQFINELSILTQVNHRNVVKVLGCCFESNVPELVYEYIPNGTLSQHIHKTTPKFTLDRRLKIAVEAASALSYLHSDASIPIIHRDVKSANILLDTDYVAKMADFGASRLVPLDQTQVTTLVQGTLGYLDPEYLQSSQLTEKSDVYSFGIVLAELLTGKKPICPERSEVERNLATYFIASMKENRLSQILDHRVVRDGTPDQLQAIAELVKRCLCLKGEDRPTMKEVVTELGRLRKYRKESKDPWASQHGHEESESLLSQETRIDLISSSTNASDIARQYSFNCSMTFPLNSSRY